MELVVRTWNLFHGRTLRETRRAHVERMISLATTDQPGVVCLQEVPVWALGRLEGWSGMACVAAVTKRALLGPLARMAQSIDARRVRSPWTGQANAVLVSRALTVARATRVPLTGPGELRVCQLLEIGAVTLANVHLANRAPIATAQLAEVAELLSERGPCVLAGDLNLRATGLPGFTTPLVGIDQVLVRGLEVVRPSVRWPDERRQLGDLLLSDHAPVETAMMWP